MNILKKVTAIAISGLLMSASASAWAQPSGHTTSPGLAATTLVTNSQLSVIEITLRPSEKVEVARQVSDNCQASHIYTADDVVGDKNACIMGGYTLPGYVGTATGAMR